MWVTVKKDDLVALLDYVQEEEEADYKQNPVLSHVVHVIRRLRKEVEENEG